MTTIDLSPLVEPRVGRRLLTMGAAWGVAITALAAQGALKHLIGLPFALLVAAGIIAPTLVYATLPTVKSWVRWQGLRPLTLLHIWRVPAGLLFLYYGAQGMLPPAFWIPAACGDLLVGLYALTPLVRKANRAFYWRFHLVGFADFAVAVGSGLVHTLLVDPRMAPIAVLPLALIPLFGVGISGASHLIAFDLLRVAPDVLRPSTDRHPKRSG